MADYRATLHAKADPEGLPFTVELVVNRRSMGSQEATPDWRDYAFAIDRQALVPGFNAFELRVSSQARPSGLRMELAIESLTLTRVDPEQH